jgi:hypothetical protein
MVLMTLNMIILQLMRTLLCDQTLNLEKSHSFSILKVNMFPIAITTQNLKRCKHYPLDLRHKLKDYIVLQVS